MKQIAIFASGSGSNAENIFLHFEHSGRAKIRVILTNKPQAGVVQRAKRLGVECLTFDRAQFCETGEVVDWLREREIDYVVLAGFLWLVPQNLIDAFPNRIVNLHPALLPKFGGRGMYGDRVHRAVVEAGETESGITIHRVNAHYDEGQIIAQFKVEILPEDTPDDVVAKIHKLEYEHFPKVIEGEIEKI